MRTENGYRYSLVFRGNTAENVRVGEFLERIGHKKSTVMIKALLEYIDRNPEIEKAGGNISITHKQTLTRQDIVAIVQELLQENDAQLPVRRPDDNAQPAHQDAPYDDTYVNSMIDKLSEHFDF